MIMKNKYGNEIAFVIPNSLRKFYNAVDLKILSTYKWGQHNAVFENSINTSSIHCFIAASNYHITTAAHQQ